jgi:hypothetical protein
MLLGSRRRATPMPSPPASSHRRARENAITIIRTYAPDPDRCVAALLTVLASTLPNAHAGGTDGAVDDRPIAEINNLKEE